MCMLKIVIELYSIVCAITKSNISQAVEIVTPRERLLQIWSHFEAIWKLEASLNFFLY